MPKVFLSYRRQDAAGHAGWLYTRLREVFGAEEVFKDVDSIRPGQSFPDVLRQHLDDCDVMLVVMGPSWATVTDDQGRPRLHDPHDYVRMEVALALEREDVRVIPVLVQNATVPPADQVPEDVRQLTYRQAVELRDQRWDDDVHHLVRVIRPRPAWLQQLGSTAGKGAGTLIVVGALILAGIQWWPPGGGGDDSRGQAGDENPTEPASPSPTGPATWRINFQAATADVPTGYLIDFGEPFGPRRHPDQGEGQRYGWVEPGTSDPKDMTAHARFRSEPDDLPLLRATLVHFRNHNPATGEIDEASWELAVPPGRYLVTASVGDTTTAQTHGLIVEGEVLIDRFRGEPSGMHYEQNTRTVDVTDGRLTLEAQPDTTTKINHVEITRLG